MARLWATALLATALAGQDVSDIRLTLSPDTLVRLRTTIAHLRVDIPPGKFVPAESRYGVTGMRVRTGQGWTILRGMPTYPPAALTPLPRRSERILAYSGSIDITLPIEIVLSTSGVRSITIAVEYELCDAAACSAERASSITRSINLVEATTGSEEFIATRVDASRVAIVTSTVAASAEYSRELEELKGDAQFAAPMVTVPVDHPLARSLAAETPVGGAWIIRSAGADFRATADGVLAFGSECGAISHVGVLATVTDAAFASERAKYFIASTDSAPASQRATRRIAAAATLTSDQRRSIERVLDEQVRKTLPTIHARSGPPRHTADPGVPDAHARVRYDVQSFYLAPDNDPRFFVRARWAAAGSRQWIRMSLWLRSRGDDFVVEATDASPARFAGMPEFRFSRDRLDNPEYFGLILNVIPASDGWSYVILGKRGYESVAAGLLKYSPNGPISTGVYAGVGC